MILARPTGFENHGLGNDLAQSVIQVIHPHPSTPA
jgi:hypothetical protein